MRVSSADSEMKHPRLSCLLFAIALLAGSCWARAHGDLHERIVALTKDIEQSPTNATLYFQRGELHRIHREWTNALADFDRAVKYDPSLSRVEFCRGRLWFEADEPEKALVSLDRYIARQTNDVEAFAVRGRAHARVRSFREAASDFTHAIALVPSGSPELYIERAHALNALGAKPEALRGLDEGIRRMGPLVTLELPAIDLEVDLKRYDAALARIEVVMSRLPRKETWLVRRARVLAAAGRKEEAQAAYCAALKAIESLPRTHRYSRATIELEATIRSALRE